MDTEQQAFWERWSSKRGKEDVKNNEVETNDTRDKNKTAIVDLIVKCSKEAIKKQEDSKFTDNLFALVLKLKEIFKSEYCALGTVDEKYVIDRACTLNLSNDLKWAPIESKSILVCKSLGCTYKKAERNLITRYDKDAIVASGNYEKYKVLLNKDPENSTIIIIQDDDGDPQGYLQFINSEKEINKDDYELYKADILRLAFVVKQWYALENERLFLKDFTFINGISGNANNVDKLLSDIMRYLSDEFNAGIISYRIPLLVGINRQPVFYLRDCYVSHKIDNCEDIKKRYFEDRLVIIKDGMGGVEKLICKNHGLPVILAEPIDSGNKIGVSQNVTFKKEAVIIPIIRDHSGKDLCTNNDRDNKDELCDDGRNCISRFEKYFGLFRLRILKSEDDGENDSIPDKVTKRLHNLAKHISVLINAIVDKDENESLKTFQTWLNDSSFTDYKGIKEFDLQCAKTIKDSTGAKVCSIYKYDKLSDEMILSAYSSKTTQIDLKRGRDELSFDPNLKTTIKNFRTWFPLEDEVSNLVFKNNEPVYYVGRESTQKNSMMLVPMMKKDGTRLGMIILIGKNTNVMNVSKTYWEQDKKYIKFMVDIISRIEESDADRLVFLLRLSHELRKPITEMVYKNDLLISTANRNNYLMSKKELLQGLKYNMNSCMMFKQIITDIETSYYMRKGGVSYNFKNENVKKCLLDVIRLFEQGGWSSTKKLVFDTQLSQMPQMMYVDKERIKQVFVNILKNAILYSDEYSTITVSYIFNKTDNCHEIDFRNYGIGITEDEKDAIFNLWERGKSAQKKRPNGTGMGLSIVKQIMEVHRGKCYVKRLNNPTIFTVSIPQK